MEPDVRLFNCALCRKQTRICSCCDRGNIYCSPGCSKAARKCAQHSAGKRYQNSRQGRLKHAARQGQYRQRLRAISEKVTHQGSPIPHVDDLLPPELSEPATHPAPAKSDQLRCHFCHQNRSDLVRLGFIQRRSPVQKQRKTSWPLGP